MIKINKHMLSVLVENQAGVLSKISGLFTRRGYNIDSLSVGETEDPEISRMTITLEGDRQTVEQIVKQLNKLIDVIKVTELTNEDSVCRELLLIKVKADLKTRSDIIGIAGIFKAKIIDVAKESLILELTGDSEKIEAFTEILKPYGILEYNRTGLTALKRGKYK
ncbi:acetolactate synthase small subunit IlvH [Gottschalkia acidurici 9a]|uniref:Acetolactate synthase small subunit n=1 Tax=Gottschalkia acidurici (strain ATCC 7906 / DSM 604 / BCRC 14475 / CIP 104303 / KCTC 5404 / NCIMB 10678 / 9a) TaxID=1128398 RepID=K0AWM3_GOTA9|nr:acetolactate synthase small subunit [Gottschalkia acidurici]AFS78228.1 acetolactate synthase small subunit IlvH [Gottschalkia acidurici 9a]